MTDLTLATEKEPQEHARAEASCDELLAEATPDAAARLDEIARSTDIKEIRKSARTALYKLSQRGIVPPERVPAPRPHNETAHTETMRAWASAYDGAGNRLFILVLAGSEGGASTVVQLLANDELGVRNLTMERRRQRDLMPLLERLEARIDEGLAVAEIEPDYARQLIERYRQVNARRSTTTPAGFLDLLPRIGPGTRTFETPPVYGSLDPVSPEQNLDVPTDPDALFKLPWFEPWFFTVEDVIPWLERWIEAGGGVVVISEKIKQERRRAISREAATALISEAVRSLYVSRLEESADVLRRRGRTREARQALHHAEALKSASAIGDNPFAETIAARTLEAAAEMAAKAREQNQPTAAPLGEQESN